ncbi:MAG: hypothetical protein J6S73_01290 [Lentisphaeria bacterium]|nr:hypothetical protein [Lentisphaeria bacterium]
MTEETAPPAPAGTAPPDETLATLKQERDRLVSERDQLTAERDRIQGELTAIRRSSQVRELADRHGFTDPEYLDYLLEKRSLAPDDAGTGSFISDLKNRSPKLFRVDLQPGAPAPAAPAAASGPPDRNAELIRRLENAPESTR